MNIAIIGYGRMGKEIEKVLLNRGHHVSYKIDQDNFNDINKMTSKDVDIAIEFTNPDSAYKNILKCFQLNIPVISGTTGWTNQLPDIKERSFKEKKGFLYASNFSVGVNILFAVNKKLAKIMNSHPEYNISIEEVHHAKKLDSPSGTAITLAEGIIHNIGHLNTWQLTDNPKDDTLAINSIRKGKVPGIHEIKYDSSADVISLSHSAKSRAGFALGAVLAAEFMQGKRNYYEMKDVLHLNTI